MKNLLILIFLISFSNADLITYEQYGTKGNSTYALCVDSYAFDSSNNLIYSIGGNLSTLNLSNYLNFNFDDAFILDSSNNCVFNSSLFGMSYMQYHFMMALTGLLTGFLIVLIVFLKV